MLYAVVAQWIEHLSTEQKVRGSSPCDCAKMILTSGKAYVDIDAYASCLAYRELLLAQGKQAVAVSNAPFAKSISKTIQKIPLEFDSYTITIGDQFIVLDVSDPTHIDSNITHKNIIELIDHRSGHEKFWQERIGDRATIIKIGAVATVVYEKYKAANITPTKDICKLLVAAIVDNTLNSKARITTKRDTDALNSLMEIGGLTKQWIDDYLQECEQAILSDLVDAIKVDTKAFNDPQLPKKLGQIMIFDHKNLDGRSNEIAKAFEGCDNWAMNVIALKDGISYIHNPQGIRKIEPCSLRKEIFELVKNGFFKF